MTTVIAEEYGPDGTTLRVRVVDNGNGTCTRTTYNAEGQSTGSTSSDYSTPPVPPTPAATTRTAADGSLWWEWLDGEGVYNTTPVT